MTLSPLILSREVERVTGKCMWGVYSLWRLWQSSLSHPMFRLDCHRCDKP